MKSTAFSKKKNMKKAEYKAIDLKETYSFCDCVNRRHLIENDLLEYRCKTNIQKKKTSPDVN